MTEDNNNTIDQEEGTIDNEERTEQVEALEEGFFQKSAEVDGDDDRPRTSEYEDGYIPERFRSEERSTGERRARDSRDTSDG